jgi:8-oxo-dGTP pyrophosphatase MutT (NUDIX family)/glyoxylase-like metal-dependent hydrolase (beta-lactamase superfamily II)
MRPGSAGAEVLLTHRPPTMAFGPGLHVFPGGAVDPGDVDPSLASRSVLDARACAAAWAGDLAPGPALAHAVAAIRELYEEAGVLLATGPDGRPPDAAAVEAAHRDGEGLAALVSRLDLRLRTDRLAPLSHWVTPPVELARRYDARFFAADAADGAGFRLDDREVVAHAWMRPGDALAACRRGRLDLWAPTATTLREIADAQGADDVRRHLAPSGPARDPVVDRLSAAVVRVRAFGAGGLPGRTVCTYLVGRHRVVVVDPGDPNEPAADAILGAIAAVGAAPAGIVLTATEPAHAGGLTGLALRSGLPVVASPGAGRELWDGLRAAVDGELLELGDVPLRVLAALGVGDGRLALDAAGEEIVLTGDLFGPGPDGIPGRYADATLEAGRARVDALGSRRRLGAHD